MARSAGVTASSIIALIGSGVTLLFAGVAALSLAIAPSPTQDVPFMKAVLIGIVVLWVAASGWGIASGIGLLRLREWARISMLVFGALLILFCLPAAASMPFLRMPVPPDVPPAFFLAIRVVIPSFYLALAALGVWWVCFFNRKAVKAQFRGGESLMAPSAAPTRPVSIGIIGWFLLVCGCFVPLTLFLHVPLMFLGFLLVGSSAKAAVLTLGIIGVVTGVGLLKLRPWARILAICYFLFGALNSLAFLVVPGAEARLQLAMAATQSSMKLPPVPPPPIWFISAAGLPLVIAVLWFLIMRKTSFTPSRPELPASES